MNASVNELNHRVTSTNYSGGPQLIISPSPMIPAANIRRM